jgi:hypothetical protein
MFFIARSSSKIKVIISNIFVSLICFFSAVGKSWEPATLGLPKREMLGDYLKRVISSNRVLQRLVAEFTDNLANLAEAQ